MQHPRVLTETTADLAWALLMAAARRITEAERFRGKQWTTWSPMLLTGMDIYGATLGIIGFGGSVVLPAGLKDLG